MFLQELLPRSPKVTREAKLPSEPRGPSDCPGAANKGRSRVRAGFHQQPPQMAVQATHHATHRVLRIR